MNENIIKLERERSKLIDLLNKIPTNCQNIIFLGEWNLKDIIAHLTGWANYQIDVIKAVKNGKEAPEPGKIDDFNQNSTETRKNASWKEVYNEWLKASKKLIDEYYCLDKRMWNAPLWKNKATNLEKFISIEIGHYHKTHIPQIEKLLTVKVDQ